MKTSRILAITGAAGVLTMAASALAQTPVTWVGDVSSADRPMVLAASSHGVVFIGPGGTVFRGFHHEQTSRAGVDQPFLWIADIDNDRHREFVGAGTPSFVIDENADPVWGIAGGCDQYFVGDFADDDAWEVFCRGERSVSVYSWDGQEYLTWEGRGWNVGNCYADDYDGDRELEVQCALTDASHLYFDLAYADPEERDQSAEPASQRGLDMAAAQAAASGESTVSLGGDVTLGFAGGSITLSRDGAQFATVPVGSGAIYSATVADLDADGADELYVGGDSEVYVIGADGALIATVPADPSLLTRDARVTVRSATAVGLEDSERESVAAAVATGVDAVTSCYRSRMGQDQFTRVGVMIWEITVDDDGDVSNTTRRHSSLQNRDLESCVEGALEDISFSPATDGTGMVTLTLDFDFIDAP